MNRIWTPAKIDIVSSLVVYLDQNKWVELLRSEQGITTDADTSKALTKLRDAVAAGRVVLPLSAAHYLETWHRTSWESRHRLAKLMRELSGYVTLAPIQHLLCLEIERLLLQHFRWPGCRCELPEISQRALGRGVNHAFHSTTGRMRLVESIAAPGMPEGPPVSVDDGVMRAIEAARSLRGDAYEWWSLAGGRDSLNYPDFEVRAEHRLGLERVRRETELAERIASDGHLRRRLDDYLALEELTFANDHINRIGFWHGSDTNGLMERWTEEGPKFGKFLLDSLPTRVCIFHIRRAKHRNPQWKWQQHDQTDMAALSAAVPYCDIVVTERQWAHVFRSTRLDARFGTTVLNRFADLVPLLQD